MSYFSEVRAHWRQLAAATAGLSAGLSLSAYTNPRWRHTFLRRSGGRVRAPHRLEVGRLCGGDRRGLLSGCSLGAEGDVIAYLESRRFDLSIYSSVLGILSAAIGVSALIGGTVFLVLSRYGPNQVVSAAVSPSEEP